MMFAMWWREGTIYQIYIRSFQDSNGDGIGDLDGIRQRLDYLSEVLGVAALWITPFYPSPMRDFGYDISDHTGVHPLFGDLEIFDRVVEEAHARGLRVIVDFVPNHTSDAHEWFLDARSSRSSPRRDWYTWRDPKPDGSPPNNWISAFGGPAWTLDQDSGQYYLHTFHHTMPDVNWRNEDAKKAQFDVIRFWMERGVDGIRIDAAQFPMKDPEMRDNPPNEGEVRMHRPLGEYDSQVHEYDHGHPDIHVLYKELRAVLDEYPDRVAIGEIHIFDWPKWAAYYGGGTDELHMVFNFGLLGATWEADPLKVLLEEIEAALPEEGGWPNWALGNHDEPRLVERVGTERARAATMLQMTLRGTPTIYYGDELAMPDARLSPDQIVDPWGQQAPELSRDPCRSPMPWNDSDHAGFCRESVTPWLPLVDEHESLAVEAQLHDPLSMLSLTRRLISLRAESPALHGDCFGSITSDNGILAFDRSTGDDNKFMAFNFNDADAHISVPFSGRVVLSTHLDRNDEVTGTLELRPNEGCIVNVND